MIYVSSKITLRVKGFRLFPLRVILEIEKDIDDRGENKTIRVLRKNDAYNYTLRIKSEVSS